MADINAGVVNLSAENLDLSEFIDAMKNSIQENNQEKDDFFDKEDEEKEIDFKSTSIETILDDIYISLNSSIRNLTSTVDMRFSVLEGLLEKEPEVTEDLIENATLIGSENIENLLMEINDSLAMLGNNITETIEDVNTVDEDVRERQQEEEDDDGKKPKVKTAKDKISDIADNIYPDLLGALLLGAVTLIQNAIEDYEEGGIEGVIKGIFLPDNIFASIGTYAVMGAGIGLAFGPFGVLAGGILGGALGGLINYFKDSYNEGGIFGVLDEMGNLFGKMFSFIGGEFGSKGAKLGFQAGGPIGAMAGGIIGSILGFIEGYLQEKWNSVKEPLYEFANNMIEGLKIRFISTKLWFEEILLKIDSGILTVKQTMKRVFVDKPIEIIKDLMFTIEELFINIRSSLFDKTKDYVKKLPFGLGEKIFNYMEKTLEDTDLDLQQLDTKRAMEEGTKRYKEKQYQDEQAKKQNEILLEQIRINKEKAENKSKAEELYEKMNKDKKEQPVNVNTNQVAYSTATYNSITNRSFVQN